MKALVVDDDPGVREIASMWLNTFGFEVVAVDNAERAREVLTQKPPFELVFTDYHMAGGNGTMVCAHCRELQPQAKVILASGNLTRDIVSEALTAGANICLSKPFYPGEISGALRSLGLIV